MNNLRNISKSCLTKQIFSLTKKPIIKNVYRTFVPKKTRKSIEVYVDRKQQNYTSNKFKEFIEYYFNTRLLKFNLSPIQPELVNKKIIWQYWGQGVDKCPDIVTKCFKSVDEFKNDYQVIRLDDSNLFDYLNLPEFIYEKHKNKEFRPAFFSDLIRLALLDVYGGIWLDATILLTDFIPGKIKNMDYFMYQRDHLASNKEMWIKYDPLYFDWDKKHKVNVLNSIIISKPKNIVIHTILDLLLNYWATQNQVPHYFFFQILYEELITGKLIQFKCEIIDDTLPHLLQTMLNDSFDQGNFKKIIEKSSIHKLRYKEDMSSNTYYTYIMKKL